MEQGGGSGDGGPATSAQLHIPRSVFPDSSDNIFIADSFNNRIRKVDVDTGIITTVAGNATPGFDGDGGPATSAKLSVPEGVFLDSSDNIFIADSSNHRIRKVDAVTGIITTVAGNGTEGFSGDGGSAASAQLIAPKGVFLDSSGNIIIADTGNQRIRKVDAATGIITTVAGNGTNGFSGDGGSAMSAQLNSPYGVFFGSTGNIFIAGSNNNRIRKVTSVQTPTITTVTPDSLPPGQSLTITLAGTNFISGMTVNVSGIGVTVSEVIVNSNTSATATFTIGTDAILGVRTLNVTTSGGTSNTVDFTINEPASVAAFTLTKHQA